MKNQIKLWFFISVGYLITTASCCEAYLAAGLNLEGGEKCSREPESCYNDVFLCKGEEFTMCWKALSDNVTKIEITDLGSVDLS